MLMVQILFWPNKLHDGESVTLLTDTVHQTKNRMVGFLVQCLFMKQKTNYLLYYKGTLGSFEVQF